MKLDEEINHMKALLADVSYGYENMLRKHMNMKCKSGEVNDIDEQDWLEGTYMAIGQVIGCLNVTRGELGLRYPREPVPGLRIKNPGGTEQSEKTKSVQDLFRK